MSMKLLWHEGLQAVILERPTVCAIAEDFVKRYELQDRIKIQEIDMWSKLPTLTLRYSVGFQ
ncbi:hypothetical protein [Scytonema sp. PRP1]|uniref:hypothetical protein n=1 Tax=Scytonema sp. PRP1 TaxID=3120513 RepID=UPI002FD5D167